MWSLIAIIDLRSTKTGGRRSLGKSFVEGVIMCGYGKQGEKDFMCVCSSG